MLSAMDPTTRKPQASAQLMAKRKYFIEPAIVGVANKLEPTSNLFPVVKAWISVGGPLTTLKIMETRRNGSGKCEVPMAKLARMIEKVSHVQA